MSRTIIPFTSEDTTLAEVGGKGANLVELTRAGFPVPPGFLVGTEAYLAFVEANGLLAPILEHASSARATEPASLEAASQAIRKLFSTGVMPENVGRAVCEAYYALSRKSGESDDLAVAVRSSATAEDLPGLSFAGQQDTYLNVVGADAVLHAVQECWGSLWTGRAIAYRARSEIAPEHVALAVVVQVLVPAEVSGVLFTANPLTGRRDEMVIDASYGLGEAIVSGQVEPDHYAVRTGSWKIVERKIGAKALVIAPRAGGGLSHNTSRAQGQQALTDAQIVELAQLAGRVADHYDFPQDIEWAFVEGQLFLLQARPITSLYPLPNPLTALSAANPHVYMSFNSIQGVTEPFTPLGGDVLRLMVKGAFHRLGGQAPEEVALPIAGGRIFVDVTQLIRDPRTRRLYLGLLSNADPGARRITLRLFDEGRVNEQRWLRFSHIRHLARVLFPRFKRAVAAVYAPEFTRARALAEADAVLEKTKADIANAKSLSALLSMMDSLLPTMLPDRLLPIMAVAVPGIATMGILDRLLLRWLDLSPGAVLPVLRGLPNNPTTEMDLALWALAESIRSDPDSAKAFQTRTARDLVEAYRHSQLPPLVQQGLARFLESYGMRAVGEIDLGRPRWRDDPAHIVSVVQGYLELTDTTLAPDRLFKRGQVEAEEYAKALVERVRSTRYGAIRARFLAAAFHRLRALAGVRESPKFYWIKTLALFRAALLKHGYDLARRGMLAHAEDLFFVPLEQLREYARGIPVDLCATVAHQRAEYERERARTRMPRVMLSTGEVFYEGVANDTDADLVGQPVSPGVVEGRARVVLDPREARLEPGEILVCPATDPGWTPLFMTAGGLVMELGGMITHGSVVAREYGIPAVVGVHQATTRLHTGQRIRVDGSSGQVLLLEETNTL